MMLQIAAVVSTITHVSENRIALLGRVVTDVVVLEDHAPIGALGSTLAHVLSGSAGARRPRLTVLGVEGWPACGAPGEALRHHALDGASVADRVDELVRRPATR